MTNILKFQTREEKARAERMAFQCSLTSHVQTDILDDGSVWFRVGSLSTSNTQNSWDKEIIWDEWRKVDEI